MSFITLKSTLTQTNLFVINLFKMIICEIGQNHCGDVKYAEHYVDVLVKFSPDAIMFQLREKEYYQKGIGAGFILPENFYKKAAIRIKKTNVKLGMAICDPDRIGFCEKIGVDFYKVPSKDIKNYSLIMNLLKTGKKVFVSTGMSDMKEIGAFVTKIKKFKDQITLVHTQLTYLLDEINLKAINAMKRKFGLPVAFGSHSPNVNALYTVLGFEPSDIFFFVRGNKRGANHRDKEHAVLLSNLSEVIRNLRELPRIIGKEEKIKMDNQIQKNNV